MATHEFGIMPCKPGKERYDSYEPEKYRCIKIDDELIEKLIDEFEGIPCYWHTISQPATNLSYCGITLIPPESAGKFIEVLIHNDADQLAELFEQAKRENKYIIHYGL